MTDHVIESLMYAANSGLAKVRELSARLEDAAPERRAGLVRALSSEVDVLSAVLTRLSSFDLPAPEKDTDDDTPGGADVGLPTLVVMLSFYDQIVNACPDCGGMRSDVPRQREHVAPDTAIRARIVAGSTD